MSICWMRVLPGVVLVALVALVACGGGGAGGAKAVGPTGKSGMAAEDPTDFCVRYRGSCASEDAARELQMEGDERVPEAEVTAKIEELYAACREKVDALSAEQREWLEACNGCGGTCDVFSGCLSGIPEQVAEPFACTQYEQDPAPHEDDADEERGGGG